MKEYDVVCLGEILIDMFPGEIGKHLHEVKEFHPKPGGAPANVAVGVRRLGSESGFIGKVGEDHFGVFLQRVLEEEGVSTRGLRFDEKARTTMAIIASPSPDCAEFVFYRNPGADQMLQPDELDLALLRNTRVFHFGSLSLTDEPVRSAAVKALREAKDAGALVSFDFNFRADLWESPSHALLAVKAILPEVDVLKMNEVEGALLSGVEGLDPADTSEIEGAAKEILEMGPALVVITMGKDGCYFQTRTTGEFVPGFKVDSLDSVGCGDAFTAGLLTKLAGSERPLVSLDQEELRGTFRFANGVGALTSMKLGAIPALPTILEVEDFLNDRG